MADEKIKGHCPTCGAERFADVLHAHKELWSVGEVDGMVRLSILRCRGCEKIYVQRAESNSEDVDHYQEADGEWTFHYPEEVTYWPAPTKRAAPEWVHAIAIDHDLSHLLNELYKALNSDLRVLAAIGVRTVFDRASELLGTKPELSFAAKLADLEAKGKIGGDERVSLSVLTDAGGAAAHRGWRPSPDNLNTLVLTLEGFLYRTMILGDALKELKAAVPQRPRPALKAKAVPAAEVPPTGG